MRQTIFWITLGLGVGTVACGGSPKPATNPSTSAATSEPAPKWDDSSESSDNARHPVFSSSSPPSAANDQGWKPSGAPPAAGSPAPPAQQRRTDSYDKEATEVVLRRAARQVKDNCGSAKDENGKAAGPWGKTVVVVALGHNGHSKGASIGSPFDGAPTGRCAIQAFSSLTYPPWAGADTTVNWEVDIATPKDAK
ncbi:hypothetical protein [Pendulispora albinea]|uniref:Secreted protein n=1 Tax=Pendulispora albinea TaxID=2741071 RepID=A0ABZ2LQG9_9BACT